MSEVKFLDKEEELSELFENVEETSTLKTLIVDYVGNKLNPEDDNVTIDMVFQVFKEEFPEFLLVLAEENYLRGFKEGLEFDDTLELEDEKKSD